MQEWRPETYGDRIAEIYDGLYDEMFDTEGVVSFISERAGGGRVLELGIGTGRIAVPLKERGVEVHGIDASQAMVDKMRAKPGGEDIEVTFGDFADVAVEGTYAVIFVAFNTVFALTSQDEQLRCFKNAAEHLTDDGVFVVEAFVPDLNRFRRHQNTEVTEVGLDHAMVDLSRHNPTLQEIRSQHVIVTEKGIELYPVVLRYIFPSEMDLMAKLAGLELRERYENWRMSPFTSNSGGHVSVYGRA